MNFTEKLQKILNDKGITAYKLCKDIEIAPNSLNNWKKGSLPTIDKFEKIVIYLDINPTDLLDLEIDDESLSRDERELIEAYRRASHKDKTYMLASAKLLAPEQEESSTSRTG